MRGDDQQQSGMFSYISPEQRIGADHPLRPIRAMADEALCTLESQFRRMYASVGRPSIAPERLLRALLLQVLYSVRSERMLMEQLDYNLLFRWFVGLNTDDAIWDASSFSKNRDRLLAGDVAQAFFAAVVKQAGSRGLLSDEHFTVDGTLLEAWASQKSFRRVAEDKKNDGDDHVSGGGNVAVDFHGERRTNETHCSTTDPDAQLARKGRGKEARLSYHGHLLTENRNGLVVNTCVTPANGRAEVCAALWMAEKLPGARRVTLGADKGYDVRWFVEELKHMNITPHVAQNTSRRSSIDKRTTRHSAYSLSQRRRKRVEEVFGWMKTVGQLRKLRYRGLERVNWMFTFAAAAYNLVRIRNLTRAVTGAQCA